MEKKCKKCKKEWSPVEDNETFERVICNNCGKEYRDEYSALMKKKSYPFLLSDEEKEYFDNKYFYSNLTHLGS